ncbi:MAG: DUF4124 domain-containing protein [Candidatus Binatia bacterium]
MRFGRVLGLIVILTAAHATADIYEWRDAVGDRHFTNRPDIVPVNQRASAQVLITDPSTPELGEAAVQPAPAPTGPAPSEGEPMVAEAYRAGFESALRIYSAGGGGGAAEGGALEINSPLAVTNVSMPAYWSGPPYGWYPSWPVYYPFVTTSFDRGRSRHQTLRMLLQDQFQLDRGGPYAYARWNKPGLGPALAPFLPRGLRLPVTQYGRVIYR